MIAKTRKKLIIVLSVVLSAVLVFIGSVFVFLKIGEVKLRESLSFTDDSLKDKDAYGDTADVYHNGQGYVYNDKLINILLIGVDKSHISDIKSKQADALYLVSLDTENNKINTVAISRNCLADIDVYDMNNEFLSTDRSQICLSYVYGSDDAKSSLLTCKAVSRLMYDLPINSYYTVFMDAVGDIVNTIGGVRVTVPEDMTLVNENWHKGANVVLKGKNALNYLRYRDDSNASRLERQKGFINSFVSTAKSAVAKDLSLPLDLYNKLSDNTVTDINSASAVYFATKMANADFNMHTIQGQYGFDGMYETFTADEDLLYRMVLDLFYIKSK